MDYSQNPYQTPKPDSSGSGKPLVFIVFGVCALLLIGIFVAAVAGLSQVVIHSPADVQEGPSLNTAKALKTAPDGWITYNLTDVGVTVELPSSVESTLENETDDYHGNVAHESWGESAFVFFRRWDYDRRETHTAESTAEYDIESHDWADKNSLSTKFSKSEIASIPAYYAEHTYESDGDKYICHAYYVIGADWFTMIDISYLEADKQKGEAEMQRIVKSMKFGKLDGLVRQL